MPARVFGWQLILLMFFDRANGTGQQQPVYRGCDDGILSTALYPVRVVINAPIRLIGGWLSDEFFKLAELPRLTGECAN